jgi:hypothetical protein
MPPRFGGTRPLRTPSPFGLAPTSSPLTAEPSPLRAIPSPPTPTALALAPEALALAPEALASGSRWLRVGSTRAPADSHSLFVGLDRSLPWRNQSPRSAHRLPARPRRRCARLPPFTFEPCATPRDRLRSRAYVSRLSGHRSSSRRAPGRPRRHPRTPDPPIASAKAPAATPSAVTATPSALTGAPFAVAPIAPALTPIAPALAPDAFTVDTSFVPPAPAVDRPASLCDAGSAAASAPNEVTLTRDY